MFNRNYYSPSVNSKSIFLVPVTCIVDILPFIHFPIQRCRFRSVINQPLTATLPLSTHFHLTRFTNAQAEVTLEEVESLGYNTRVHLDLQRKQLKK